MPPSWYDAPKADWEKLAATKAEWQKIAEMDPMQLWLRTVPRDGVVLGLHKYGENQTDFKLADGLRSHHLYIVGAAGSGKSTLLVNMMKQDIEQGRGFAVIDPHGDLIENILPHIPKSRIADTVYFNPADRECPISLNPLVAKTEEERDLVTANFMLLFTRLFGVKDAPRLLHILRHVVLTLLESGNKTFLDIRTLLMNDDFRARVLADVHNPYLLEFWEEEFPRLPKNAIDPVINKLAQFRLNSIVRNVLGQPDTAVDFAKVMHTGQMFFANLAQGKIQEENTILLGSILVTLIQLATMARAHLRPEMRKPFTLYIDEFQNFTAGDSSAFEKILSEARKYNLSLVLAHQFTSQLPSDMRSAILGNVYTMAVFQIGLEDAKLLYRAFTGRTVENFQNLSIGEAILRSGKADNNFTLKTYPPPHPPAANFVRELIDYSRSHYGKPPQSASPPQHSDPSRRHARAAQSPATPEPEPSPIDPWQ